MSAYRITVEVTVTADTEPDPEDFVFELSPTAGDIGVVMGTPQFEIEEIDPRGPSADLPTCPECAEVVHDADCRLVGDGRPITQ